MSKDEGATKELNISNLQTAYEHRDSVLTKVNHYLACVVENIDLQPESDEQEALRTIMNDLHMFAMILGKSKGKEEFVEVSSYLDQVLQREFFEKVMSKKETE